jgi:hypothetical protein
MKLDLLTNATVVNDSMRFVSNYYSINNKRLISKQKDSQESNEEPDYDEQDSLINKQKKNRNRNCKKKDNNKSSF